MIITYPIAFLFEIIFPFAIGIWFMRRYRTTWKLFWIGALVFIGSQVFHLPFLSGLNALFLNGTLQIPPKSYQPIFNAVVGGLAAGLFEETARAVAFWRLKGQARSWKAAATLGIGHEAAESILIAGLPLLVNYVVMMLAAYAPQVIPGSAISTLQAQVPLFFATTWDLPLASALERLSTFPIQIALTVLVYQAFRRHNALWFVAAVLWHAVIDGSIVFIRGLGIWPIEGILVLVALLNVGIILALRRGEPSDPAAPDLAAPVPVFGKES
jgi:uncharacterized membrane protein YhfC